MWLYKGSRQERTSTICISEWTPTHRDTVNGTSLVLPIARYRETTTTTPSDSISFGLRNASRCIGGAWDLTPSAKWIIRRLWKRSVLMRRRLSTASTGCRTARMWVIHRTRRIRRKTTTCLALRMNSESKGIRFTLQHVLPTATATCANKSKKCVSIANQTSLYATMCSSKRYVGLQHLS